MVNLDKAVQLLEDEDVVGMPTETVYGLAGSIYSDKALRKIFAIKGRPFFDPLIVHVASIEMASQLVQSWPSSATILAAAYWPGPLTMVLPKNEKVSDLITSGLETVAIRMPNHPVALKLIKAFKYPLAAPSANKFGKTSPTEKLHVEDEFKDDGLLVLEGGACQVGIESTIVMIEELNEKMVRLTLLRAGMLTFNEIKRKLEEHLYRVVINEAVEKKLAPGRMKHHYMPKKPLIIVKSDLSEEAIIKRLEDELIHLPAIVEGVEIIKPAKIEKLNFLNFSTRPEEAARELYGTLRRESINDGDVLIFKKEEIHEGEAWAAFFDRINKAASLIIT